MQNINPSRTKTMFLRFQGVENDRKTCPETTQNSARGRFKKKKRPGPPQNNAREADRTTAKRDSKTASVSQSMTPAASAGGVRAASRTGVARGGGQGFANAPRAPYLFKSQRFAPRSALLASLGARSEALCVKTFKTLHNIQNVPKLRKTKTFKNV